LRTERTDEDWLRDLKGSGPRNRDAYQALRTLLIHRLRRAFGDRGIDPATIEDFAQDGLVRVLQGLESYRGDSGFLTWATVVALRAGHTALRRTRWKERSLEGFAFDQWLVDDTPVMEDVLEKQSLFAAMQRVIDRDLTPRQRFAVLAKLEGVPQVTLAERLGTNTNALHKLQHDARRKLRQGILDAGYSEDDVKRILDQAAEPQ
jgi:RNA polymerase sigma-70 factor (ECF subfamily)